MPLPLNPPNWYYTQADKLAFSDADIAHEHGMYFWTYPDREWAVGPYLDPATALLDRSHYASMDVGPELRVWQPASTRKGGNK